MKLHQLNIWQGRLMMNVKRFLEKNTPDILCLQEACSAQSRSFDYDNIEELQRHFDFPHIFFSPTNDFRLGEGKVTFGNAILSRVPIEPVKTVFTIGEFFADDPQDGNAVYPRNFQHAIVSDGMNKVNIINHHGHWFPGVKTGDAETMRQMTMVADYIKPLQGGVIFTGDLNLLPESPSLARLNTELENLCITHKTETTRNFTSYRPDQVCDFIYVRDIKVNKFSVSDEVISDHNLLELVFNEG